MAGWVGDLHSHFYPGDLDSRHIDPSSKLHLPKVISSNSSYFKNKKPAKQSQVSSRTQLIGRRISEGLAPQPSLTPLLRIQRLRFASAIVLRIAFGVTLTGDDDPHIQIAIDANTAAAEGGSPGATVVDYFPFLSMLPGWMVPSKALRHARQWRWAIQRLHDIPFAAAREAFVRLAYILHSLWERFNFSQLFRNPEQLRAVH